MIGICIAIHGIVLDNIIHFLPYEPYQAIDFASEMEHIFHVPVILENEANLSALGEWAYCHHTKNMIHISVHSGIGIGIIMNNQLISGQNGYAGEFGHSIIEINGRQCPCGNHGCLEQYASERILLKELASLKQLDSITPAQFVRLYQDHDTEADIIVERFIHYMTVGINNLLVLFNPEIIVINSVFTSYFPQLTERITQRLQNFMKPYCKLVSSERMDASILLGGVYLCKQNFLFSQN
ncbi:MAG: ROK family protein [Clostridiales bacterium]|nr:ROK family protein [Clostridiales bacterium]